MRRIALWLAGLTLSCGPPAVTPAPSPTVAPAGPALTVIADRPAPAVEPPAVEPPAVTVEAPCVVDLASATTPWDKIDRVRTTCGDALVLSSAAGLGLYDADARLLAPLSARRGRHLQFDTRGDRRDLYLFAHDAPRLLRLDLKTGEEKKVVELPRLNLPCFGRRADPISYIQSPSDLYLDPASDLLCLGVKDRNESMMNIGVNLAVDLATGKVDQRVVAFTGCEGDAREPREQPAACSAYELNHPADAPEQDEDAVGRSPSGLWRHRFAEVLPAGDAEYALPMLESVASKQTFAVTQTGLVPYRLPGVDDPAQFDPVPARVCQLAGEYTPTWLPRTDVLLLPHCGGDVLLVRPSGRVTPVTADGYVALP